MERSSTDYSFALNALVIGAGLWIGYKILTSALDGLKTGGDKVGGAIGSTVAKWLLPAPIGVLGKIVLQKNGAILDPTLYPIRWISSSLPDAQKYDGKIPTISYLGVTYILGEHDLNGNYPAVQL